MTASKSEYHDEEPQSGEPAQHKEEREHRQETVRRESPKIGRNDPCPCGSGKKYKNCCMKKDMADAEQDFKHIPTQRGDDLMLMLDPVKMDLPKAEARLKEAGESL